MCYVLFAGMPEPDVGAAEYKRSGEVAKHPDDLAGNLQASRRAPEPHRPSRSLRKAFYKGHRTCLQVTATARGRTSSAHPWEVRTDVTVAGHCVADARILLGACFSTTGVGGGQARSFLGAGVRYVG